ncbi:MAG: trigger factor [Clostridiales bacterium]|jgi:trigger factor|nr:trigger factor [Clostridiales bacterium]
MKYQIKRDKNDVELSFEVDAADWNKELEAAYNKTKYKYAVDGWRKGKVPRSVIEKRYGANVFFDEAFGSCAWAAYASALKEHSEIVPVSDPKFDVDDLFENGGPLKFTVAVTASPDVTLGAYKGLKIPKTEAEPVTDADVDAALESDRARLSRLVSAGDRPVRDGDTVNLDYSGSVGGVKFDGGTAEKSTLVIGSGSFIPGFEERLIGLKTGESRDIKVTFPADYHEESLRGKEAVFAVKINGVSVRELPELNDEFAKDVSKFETLADYKKDIRESLAARRKELAENENKSKLVDGAVAGASVDIPACMIEDELEYMLDEFGHRLSRAYGGVKLDDYLNYTGSSREEYKEHHRADAEKAVKTRLVLQKIIGDEKLFVSEDDLNARIDAIARDAGKTADEYKAALGDNIDRLRSDLVFDKLVEFLTANNTYVAAPAKKAAQKKPDAPNAEKAAAKGEPAAEKAAARSESTAAKKAPSPKTDAADGKSGSVKTTQKAKND